jgi:hypothetical protein
MKEEKTLQVRCPKCKRIGEPDYNETTHRYVCPVCAGPLDAQVMIEKKKKGQEPNHPWRNRRET